MAFTKAQLEALKNTLLASNQPILASQHRQQVQGIIDEMYDAQSRGNILVGVQSDTVSGSSDTFLVFRSGQAYQLPVSLVNANDLANLGDVFINDLQDGDSLVYDAIADRWENRSILLGFALANLTDVELTSLAGDDVLRYNAVSSKWENVSLATLLAPYALLTDLNAYQLLSEKGQANGYASLDTGGKVPLSQINDAILGQVSYQGTWNASTNTPTLANPPASTTKGDYYVVSVGGSFAGLTFEVGDWIISNGAAWEKVNNTDAVRTVFGRLGDVVANAGDYAAFYVTLNTAQTITATKTFSNSGSAENIIVNHTSGSGIALDITKGGNGEGIRVNKTSGSGNAATIIGTLEATTLVKSGGTASQYLMADGSVSTLTNPITGTGVAGQVAFWNGTNSQTGDNGLFWDNVNKRLGVGTNAPLVKLDIGTGGVLRASSGGANFVDLGYNVSTGPEINTQGYDFFRFKFFGTERFQVTSNGPTLIGDFNLNGVNNLAYLQLYSASSGVVRLANKSSNANFGRLFLATDSIDRFGIFTNGNVLIQNGGTFTDAGFRLDVNGTTRFQGNSQVTGNLLLNTTVDAGFRLDVNGTARVQGELTVNTVQIGLGGGSIASNTRVGVNALNANTTGSSNVAIGASALFDNTTGNNNTANGRESLRNNTTGGSNTANGFSALRNNTTGNNNTANGTSALFDNTTGSNNIAFGVNAGRFIADGTTANTITNNSVFLGLGTRALADNQTNQIVIGNEAIGNGSNTATIGNASLTHLYFTGAKTISTTTGNLTLATAGGNGNILLSPNGTGRVGIGTASPATSAILDLSSTTGALLLPRMTTTQRDALTAVNGMIIYNTTTNTTEARQDGAWVDLSFVVL
jgi:hypothetical protein